MDAAQRAHLDKFMLNNLKSKIIYASFSKQNEAGLSKKKVIL